MAEDAQQVVQQAVQAADEVQGKLHEVSGHLLEVGRHLRKERGHNRAVHELRQANAAASQVRPLLRALDRELREATRVVSRRH
jgi:hypothetical protein